MLGRLIFFYLAFISCGHHCTHDSDPFIAFSSYVSKRNLKFHEKRGITRTKVCWKPPVT